MKQLLRGITMHPNLKEAQELIRNIGANCAHELDKVVQELKELVDSNKINNFTFRKNDYPGISQQRYIIVEIQTKADNRVLLGAGDLVGYNLSQVSKGTLEKLEKLGEYLDFLNTHCAPDLPLLKNNTYYSPGAENKKDYWNEKGVEIYPTFEAEALQSKTKMKI